MSFIISDDELNSTPVESEVSSAESEPEEDGEIVSDEEWNRSTMEVDEGFRLAGDAKNTSLELNDKYEAAVDHIHALEQSNQYAEAKMECKTLLEGELKHRCANAAFWITFADIEKRIGSLDDVVDLYDRGCNVLKNNPEEQLKLSLSMRAFVEEVVEEEEAVDELDLPVSGAVVSKKKMRRANAMSNYIRQRERVSLGGEQEHLTRTPSRPETKTKRHESMSPLKNLSPDCIESTMIVLTPIRASKSQREKHKCDMILSPVRKSTRLMKYNHKELVGDKLIGTTYAYANNKNIANKPVDC
ncbi:hypothetical protein AV274_2825 [Blastocystis sp. ATCC 50177/Nand II]|uniref:Uncharacterized protein n=1 Tax=Blastocystis sp. subtype 1 (strain ATCC 50177 / NandII) TaxID=478820 RepID=A0A196SGP4_BLAHN|nr:hypothetical protein AV274_2825 [Blastocystis sp. ATCC 50177/Nand II]